MKPNGRRRWRKWLARERKGRMAPSGRGTEPWCWWASCDGTRVVRRHRGGEWVTGSLPDLATMPLPAREFSARSLCGMTQGARKRAARVEAISGDAATLALQSRKVWLLWWRQGCLGGMPKLAAYPSIRAKYRLGERLRPCLVCQWAKCKLPCGDCSTCDGSGVLPAKRHRRCGWWLKTRTAMNATQRCGMPTADGWFDCQNCGGSGWLMGRGE